MSPGSPGASWVAWVPLVASRVPKLFSDDCPNHLRCFPKSCQMFSHASSMLPSRLLTPLEGRHVLLVEISARKTMSIQQPCREHTDRAPLRWVSAPVASATNFALNVTIMFALSIETFASPMGLVTYQYPTIKSHANLSTHSLCRRSGLRFRRPDHGLGRRFRLRSPLWARRGGQLLLFFRIFEG